jgi:phage gp36-like protein
MTYCTLDQLTDRYGEPMLVDLTDRAAEPTNEIDTEVIDRALADADAVIDGYLKGRYLLPLASTPPLLCDLAQVIAVYKLHRNAASEKIRKDYEDAMRSLREIASGAIRLDVAGIEPASSGTSGVRTSDRPRDLTPENMKGFI